MADTNINFFDTNKLYVKSLADYKTRNFSKAMKEGSLPPKILPALDKKALTRKNSKGDQPKIGID